MTCRGVFGINRIPARLVIAVIAMLVSNLGMLRVQAYAEPTLTPVTPARFIDMRAIQVSPPAWEPRAKSDSAATQMEESFEGEWPAAGWQLADQGVQDGGEYLWGKRNCHPHNQDGHAAWSVGGGAQGAALDCNAHYPNHARTWAVFGPFDLSRAVRASLAFYLWGRVEGEIGCPFDLLYIGASTNRAIFDGAAFCGDWTNGVEDAGYYRQTLDLSARLGQSQVWIGLGFISDNDTTDIGITLDDISLDITYPTPTPTPSGQPIAGRLSLPLALKVGRSPRTITPTPTATLPAILTATATPTPTPTWTPTPTPTTQVNSGHFVGVTNQGRAVQVDLLPGGTLVGRFYIEYSITCPFMTQTGYINSTSTVGWPIANGQFEIVVGAGGGAYHHFSGQFNPQFTSVQGTWLIWAVVYDPSPRPVCSNSGTWSASAQQ